MRDFDYLHSMCKSDNEIYFTVRGIDGIFHYDINTENIVSMTGSILMSDSCADKTIALYGDFLVLLPLKPQNCIEFFSLSSRSIIKKITLVNECQVYFDKYFIYNDFLYALNNWSENPSIYVIDMKRLEVEKVIRFNREVIWEHEEDGRLFSNDIAIKEGILYLATGHYLVKVFLSDDTINVVKIDCDIKDFINMCVVDDSFWFTDNVSSVICWKNGKIVEKYNIIEMFPDITINCMDYEYEYINKVQGYAESYQYFNHSFLCGDKIYWIPGRANFILSYNIRNNKWVLEQSVESKEFHPGDGGHSLINFCNDMDNEAVIFFVDQRFFWILNYKESLRKKMDMNIQNIKVELDVILEESDLIACNLKSFLLNNYVVKDEKA